MRGRIVAVRDQSSFLLLWRMREHTTAAEA